MLTRKSEHHEEHECEGNVAIPQSVLHNFQEVYNLQEVSNCSHDFEISPVFEEKDDKHVLGLILVEDPLAYDESEDVFSPSVEHKDQSSIFQQLSIFQNGEDLNVIHVVASTLWQPCPLYQMEMFCHRFQDPITNLMESLFPNVPHDIFLGKLSTRSSKYEQPFEFLLHISCYFHSCNCT